MVDKYNVNAPYNNTGNNQNEVNAYYKNIIEHGSANNIKHEILPMMKDERKRHIFRALFTSAIRSQNIDKIKVFLDAGVDINSYGFYGETYLFNAVYTNNADIVKLFLEKGADTTIQEGSSGDTALHDAVKNNLMNSVNVLLEYGANVNTENISNYTPLMSAIMNNNKEMVDVLLKYPTLDINYQNNEGDTALHYALKNVDMALLLIENGASLTIANNEGETPNDLIETKFKDFPKERIEKALQNYAWKRRRAAVMSRAIALARGGRRTHRRRGTHSSRRSRRSRSSRSSRSSRRSRNTRRCRSARRN